MLNHKHKLLFIHIPKTGGTSIETALKLKHNHMDHEFYKKTLKNYTDFFVFTVVRNPFDRVVSDYKWVTNTIYPTPAIELKNMFIGKSFRYFVDTYYSLEFKDVQQFRDKNWFKEHHLTHCRSQSDILKPVCEIDYIIKFENLQRDFDNLCSKTGITQQQLPHANKTDHKHYTEYYDDETCEIVAEKYAQDIEYFNYTFGG